MRATIDLVSVADILRNAFVYPPHSIFEDIKLVTFGFSPSQDMQASPEFHFKFRDSGKRADTEGHPDHDMDWVGTYHRLLCEAVSESTRDIGSPWLLQSGGKDSTTLAIAVADARPDTTCITYLGGREENEVESATFVARTLGLRHETLMCDPGRAYDRYLAVADRMPLLTADFALLSYVDLATEIAGRGGDGVIDGLGADSYFGTPMSRQQRTLMRLARGRAPAIDGLRATVGLQQFRALLPARHAADERPSNGCSPVRDSPTRKWTKSSASRFRRPRAPA